MRHASCSAAIGAIGALAASTACTTPYQPMGLSGGYEDKQLDNGDYLITVRVSRFTDRAAAMEYVNHRADDLYPDGYAVVDQDDPDHREESAVIRCSEAPPPPSHPPAPTVVDSPGQVCFAYSSVADAVRHSACAADLASCQAKRAPLVDNQLTDEVSECTSKVVAPHPPRHGFFCATSASGPLTGFCVRKREVCDATRTAIGGDLSACAAVAAAQCFIVNGKHICAPTADACTARRGREADQRIGSDAAISSCSEMK